MLNYVVVKFAGSNVDPENQLNGIAFQGRGLGHRGSTIFRCTTTWTTGVEFFGGTVNARHVVLTGNADDSLDWTDGWQGSIQYLVIDQAGDSADNGIEADNREGDEDAMPRVSLPAHRQHDHHRQIRRAGHPPAARGTGLELYNSVVQDSGNCLRIQGASLDQLGTGIAFDGVSFDCDTWWWKATMWRPSRAELDGSNVSTTGQVVEAADLSGDSFFEDTDFIGARQERRRGTGPTVGRSACRIPQPTSCARTAVRNCPMHSGVGGRRTCELSGTITSDLTLTRSNYYILDGKVTIGGDNRDSAALSIESGTTIIGDDATDFLVISRGSRIEGAWNPALAGHHDRGG